MDKKLTAEYVRSILDYDPETGVFRWKYRNDVPKEWNTRYAGKIAGSVSKSGYLYLGIKGKLFYAHRIVFLVMTGAFPINQIDHINNNRSDNKWKNIREASSRKNCQNRRLRKDNFCGYKGVGYNKRQDSFYSNIVVNGKRIFLGYYKTAENAHSVYCEASKKYFGEFARAA